MPVPLSRTRRLSSCLPRCAPRRWWPCRGGPHSTAPRAARAACPRRCPRGPVVQLAGQPERGGHAHRLGHLLDHVHDLVAQPRGSLAPGLQGEDRLADVVDGHVQVIDHAAYPLLGCRAVDHRHRALQLHPAGVKPLDDQVVQVPGDPVPVLEHRQPLRVAAPLGQLQPDRGLRRERRDQVHGGPRKRHAPGRRPMVSTPRRCRPRRAGTRSPAPAPGSPGRPGRPARRCGSPRP